MSNFRIKYVYEIRALNGKDTEEKEELIPEFDLPFSMSQTIATKMKHKGIWGNQNKNGTLIRNLIPTEKAIKPVLEFRHGTITIEYDLIQKFVRIKKTQCPYCEECEHNT